MKMKLMWGLRGILALAFLFSGGMKLIGNPIIHGHFELWGYPDWFCYLIGAVEILGAAGLFVTRFARPACAVLGVTMIGAMITHFTHAEAPQAVAPFVLLALLGVTFWMLHQNCRPSGQAGQDRSQHAA